eukprot:jgi/Botrbrau1/9134/Bobra.160_3s0010.1
MILRIREAFKRSGIQGTCVYTSVSGHFGSVSAGASRHNPLTQLSALYSTWIPGHPRRSFSTIESEQEQIDNINDAFVTAREEIEYALEDAESTYFNESYQTAKSAVEKALGDFNSLLQRLDPPEKEKLQRSMGLKMEQLKAELEQLDRVHS